MFVLRLVTPNFVKFIALCCSLLLGSLPNAQPAEPLLQQADLTYAGGFKLPRGQIGGSNFTNGGLVMAYNPANDSLFIVGHGDFGGEQFVAELKIPALSTSTNLADLSTATVLQPFADITDGKKNTALSTSCAAPNLVGGLLVVGGKLLVNTYCAYDSDQSQVVFHGNSPLDLSNPGDFQGMFSMSGGPQGDKAGYKSGWMALIPQSWRAALGGDVLTGNCCLSITARTSVGPSAFAFNSADSGVKNPIPSSPLFYYTLTNPLRNNQTQNLLYNASTRIRGMVFPSGSRSILYFGSHGTGPVCYGATPVPCNDPADSNKGYHAFPYRSQIWLYDAVEVANAKNGTIQPWAVQPYATLPLDFPNTTGTAMITGAAYDPAGQRIFVAQLGADNNQSVIRVLKVGAPGEPTPPPAAPAAPSNLIIR